MILPTLATLRIVALLEDLKVAQDTEDALFLSRNVERILNEWEKIKEEYPAFKLLLSMYKEEGINIASTIQ